MECREFVVDLRDINPEEAKEEQRTRQLLYRLNQTDPSAEEYMEILREIFGEKLGKNSFVAPGLHGACISRILIGENVFVNSNALFMARGGITLEDNVMLAADASIITNNHDPYDRRKLVCRPVLVKEGAWIGAHAVVLPGVCIGRKAIVGAGAIVTKDVPDYGVAVGNPAHVISMLDPEKFSAE